MCSVDETSEREMKGSEDITHARVIDSRLIYLEKISFFVRDNHNFLKVFEIHLPWWYFETLYNEIPSYHRPKLFFTSEFLFVGERKKKKKKNIENVQKFSFPLEKFLLSFLEKYDRCVHESPYVQFARRYFASESNLKSRPRFPYYRNFCPFSRTSTPRQRSYASTPPCLENPLQLVFVRSTNRLHDGSKETRLRENKEKRRSAARFVEIRANFSYDFKRSW